ncbi:hypothetical protein LCGC14_1116750 [marine sediment metagenome]|uniref:ASCH domain-containing protein n=1 Tax=marine sediment metagenome TaxID=412755 RepID=A0A0F9M9X4_9ZZZZ
MISPSDMVRALTIHQPHAWAIAQGWKDVENRTWPAPGYLLGEWVAIHASKSFDDVGADTFANLMHRTGRRALIDGLEDVRGAIVAVVRLEGSVLSEASPWFTGPHGFLLRDVIKLHKPIECRGALNFWRLPFAVDAELREQLAQLAPASTSNRRTQP